jgi:hypothetical protein
MTTPVATPRPRRARTLGRVALPLLGIGWVIATAWLVLAAFGASLTFFGELPTPEEQAATRRLLLAAAVVGTVVPLAGLLLAGSLRSRAGLWTFGVLLVLGGLLAGLVGLSLYRDRAPAPTPRPTVCQEHSGGDTRCPGG